MAKDWNAKQELSREIKPQTPRSKDRDWGTVIEDPFALLDAIDALKGRSDEFSRARRLALRRRLWQYQWEQVFRSQCESLHVPMIADLNKPEDG